VAKRCGVFADSVVPPTLTLVHATRLALPSFLLALARALVTEPRALLLDEPLSNLDKNLRDEMRNQIRDIQRRLGITTIMVTHDQTEALSMADEIVVINGWAV